MFAVRQARVIPFRLLARCGMRAAVGASVSVAERSPAPRIATLLNERSRSHARGVALAVAALRARRLVSLCAYRGGFSNASGPLGIDLPEHEGP